MAVNFRAQPNIKEKKHVLDDYRKQKNKHRKFYVIYYCLLLSRNTACEDERGCARGTFSCPRPFPDAYASPGTSREGAASVRPGTPPETHANASPGTPIVGARMADAAMAVPRIEGDRDGRGRARAKGVAAAERGGCVRGTAVRSSRHTANNFFLSFFWPLLLCMPPHPLRSLPLPFP
jgi:hypothetical protein